MKKIFENISTRATKVWAWTMFYFLIFSSLSNIPFLCKTVTNSGKYFSVNTFYIFPGSKSTHKNRDCLDHSWNVQLSNYLFRNYPFPAFPVFFQKHEKSQGVTFVPMKQIYKTNHTFLWILDPSSVFQTYRNKTMAGKGIAELFTMLATTSFPKFTCSAFVKKCLWKLSWRLTESHAMRQIYLKTIGGRPRPDWYRLSSQVNGHKVNGRKRTNKRNGCNRTHKRNQSRSGKASNITGCTRKWPSQDCPMRDFRRLLLLRNRESSWRLTWYEVINLVDFL